MTITNVRPTGAIRLVVATMMMFLRNAMIITSVPMILAILLSDVLIRLFHASKILVLETLAILLLVVITLLSLAMMVISVRMISVVLQLDASTLLRIVTIMTLVPMTLANLLRDAFTLNMTVMTTVTSVRMTTVTVNWVATMKMWTAMIRTNVPLIYVIPLEDVSILPCVVMTIMLVLKNGVIRPRVVNMRIRSVKIITLVRMILVVLPEVVNMTL